MNRRCGYAALLLGLCGTLSCLGAVFEIHPALVQEDEEFERVANSLKPGDELVLHGGVYSQTGRRAITVQGTADQPVTIRAADGQEPVLTRPAADNDRFNNIEFVDCSHLIVRGLRFQGGSSGVRFIRGHHVTFENGEICRTSNNALTMNSGNCDAFTIRNNHIHHTGLREDGPTEGEGMYIGCHDGSCITTNSLIEGNHVHHLRGISIGGSDGIEVKYGSYDNTIRNNVIHDTNLGRPVSGDFRLRRRSGRQHRRRQPDLERRRRDSSGLRRRSSGTTSSSIARSRASPPPRTPPCRTCETSGS